MTAAETQLAAELLKSKTVKVGDQEITRRELGEILDVVKYERSVSATIAANPWSCLQRRKIVPGGGGQ